MQLTISILTTVNIRLCADECRVSIDLSLWNCRHSTTFRTWIQYWTCVSLLLLRWLSCLNFWIVCDVENNSVSPERNRTENSERKMHLNGFEGIRQTERNVCDCGSRRRRKFKREFDSDTWTDRYDARCQMMYVCESWGFGFVRVCVCASSIWKWTQHRSIYYFMYLERLLAMRHGHELRSECTVSTEHLAWWNRARTSASPTHTQHSHYVGTPCPCVDVALSINMRYFGLGSVKIQKCSIRFYYFLSVCRFGAIFFFAHPFSSCRRCAFPCAEAWRKPRMYRNILHTLNAIHLWLQLRRYLRIGNSLAFSISILFFSRVFHYGDVRHRWEHQRNQLLQLLLGITCRSISYIAISQWIHSASIAL